MTISLNPAGMNMTSSNGTFQSLGFVTMPNSVYFSTPEVPVPSFGALSEAAERLDMLSLDLEIPELLEISENLSQHFYAYEELLAKIDRMEQEIRDLRMKRDRHNDLRMEAMIQARYGMSDYTSQYNPSNLARISGV